MIRLQAGVKMVGGTSEGMTGIYKDQVKLKLPKLPAFVDRKDNLDTRLHIHMAQQNSNKVSNLQVSRLIYKLTNKN